jgi:hypothetical protein
MLSTSQHQAIGFCARSIQGQQVLGSDRQEVREITIG